MTSAAVRRRLPVQRRRSVGKRPGTVYEFACFTHADTLAWLKGNRAHPTVTERGYDGQTRQTLAARASQHDDKPWADLVDRVYPIWQGRCTNAKLDRLEVAAIRSRGARYNIEYATDLPWHVPKWVQYEQRWARDDAAGRPRWVPPEGRLPAVPARWAPWQQKVALWVVAWLLLAVGLFGWLDRVGAPGPWDVRLAGLGATGLLVWGLRGNVRLRWRR